MNRIVVFRLGLSDKPECNGSWEISIAQFDTGGFSVWASQIDIGTPEVQRALINRQGQSFRDYHPIDRPIRIGRNALNDGGSILFAINRVLNDAMRGDLVKSQCKEIAMKLNARFSSELAREFLAAADADRNLQRLLAGRGVIWPFDRQLILQLAINVHSLEERLGVVPSAEQARNDRWDTSCAKEEESDTMPMHELKALADMGNPFYQRDYAYRLDEHQIDGARKKYFEYMFAAALQSCPFAQVTVAGCLQFGSSGAKKDPAAAFDWNLKAARQGHPGAAINVAYQFLEGDGIDKNGDEAMAWFTYAAIRGRRDAHQAVLELKQYAACKTNGTNRRKAPRVRARREW